MPDVPKRVQIVSGGTWLDTQILVDGESLPVRKASICMEAGKSTEITLVLADGIGELNLACDVVSKTETDRFFEEQKAFLAEEKRRAGEVAA